MDVLVLKHSIFEALVFGMEIRSIFKHFYLHDFEEKYLCYEMIFFLKKSRVISDPLFFSFLCEVSNSSWDVVQWILRNSFHKKPRA